MYFIVRINHEDKGILFDNRQEMNEWVSGILHSSTKISNLTINEIEVNKTFKEKK